MEKPTIIVNNRMIEMPMPKARLWREIVKFEDERQSVSVDEFCDGHINIIARAFGVTTDEIFDNIDVDEILPTYRRILTYIMQLLTSKLTGIKKNMEEDITAQV